jgi:hypothetical protein
MSPTNKPYEQRSHKEITTSRRILPFGKSLINIQGYFSFQLLSVMSMRDRKTGRQFKRVRWCQKRQAI